MRVMKALALAGVLGATSVALAADEFHGPVKFSKAKRLHGGKSLVKVEAPGYAAPCLADIDGDEKKDLLVGQFRDGKIRVYKWLGDGKFGPGRWLQASGEVAKVPGVW
ncbi:MAG: hypothetical protein AAF488_18175 [Planctomycetota bacterium]